MADEDRSPSVLAYRMGRVEKGLEKLEGKLDIYAAGFVTATQMQQAQIRADEKHLEIAKDCQEKGESLQKQINEINSNLSKGVWLVISAVILAVVGSVLANKTGVV